MTTMSTIEFEFEDRPQPIPLTKEEEKEKVLALVNFREYKYEIMNLIDGYTSTSDPEQEKAEQEKADILEKFKENCPLLYEYGRKMTIENTRKETDKWNGEPYIVRDPYDNVRELRRILICQPGCEGMIMRSICDGDPWFYEHWGFNSIILFIIEKIGLQEVKEILKSTI